MNVRRATVGALLCLAAVASGTPMEPARAQVEPTSPVGATASVSVVINEIYYHPVDDNPANEFVELLNAGDAAVDLAGWCLSGVTYCFPAGSTVAAGALVVLRPGQYSGSLSNSGELIQLLDAGGEVIDSVDYDDRGQWPAVADGDGPSLERRDPSEPGTDPGNWVAGTAPSPGVANPSAGVGLLPVFSNVAHTTLPSPSEPVIVTAQLAHATTATLFYRIGFGAEVAVSMSLDAGAYRAEIPPQQAGALVRYRLVAVSDDSQRTGTWPRQGDGSTYSGTTVASAAASGLPEFEWFIPDDEYQRAYRDLTLTGDTGYASVFAYQGTIFDNALVRVKGLSSRTATKKKWKFTLPAGYEFDMGGQLPVPVDEFSLDTANRDDSFVRDVLAAELMTEAGVVGVQQMFPVRVERNGQFYGLYAYTEQSDGSWRDRYGFDDEDAIIYEVGDRRANGRLSSWHLQMPPAEFRLHYGKETREYEDDTQLRTLISRLSDRNRNRRRTWLMQNVDLPQVINAAAASTVLQNDDFGAHNYRLVLGASGRWRVIPNDFDVTLGVTRLRPGDLPPFGSRMLTWIRNPEKSALFDAIIDDPVLGPLYRRRVRSLAEVLLDPTRLELRLAELRAVLETDALLDGVAWPSFPGSLDLALGIDEVASYFAALRRRQLLVTAPASGALPGPQGAVPPVELVAVGAAPTDGGPEWIELYNPASTAVDVSGWSIRPVGFTAPPGTVIGARSRVRLVSDITADTHASVAQWFVIGEFEPGLPDDGAHLTLVTAAGDIADSLTYGDPADPAPLVIVNEINAVADDKLPAGGADAFWGSTPTGNGRDWVELVVVGDHLDLRGWSVLVSNNGGAAVELVLPDQGALADVRSGTILTISEQLATDLSVDPSGGDWWMNLQMSGFDTSNSNTQVTIEDASGAVVFGPVGEGINPLSGVGSDELAALDVSPSPFVTAASAYRDAKVSSFGAANVLSTGSLQDFDGLRVPVIQSNDRVAPSAVTGLASAAAGPRMLSLSWAAASDNIAVAGYRVFANGVLVAEPSTAGAEVGPLVDGVPLQIEVVAVDAAGNRSAVPAMRVVTLPDATAPPPLRGVGARPKARSLRVSWWRSPDPGGVAGYDVRLGDGPVRRTRRTFVVFERLSPATTYTVHVRAVDRSGNAGPWVTRQYRTG